MIHEQKIANAMPGSNATPSNGSLLSETFQLSESKENLSVGKGAAQPAYKRNSTKLLTEFGTELNNDNTQPSDGKEMHFMKMMPIETCKAQGSSKLNFNAALSSGKIVDQEVSKQSEGPLFKTLTQFNA